MINNFMSTSRDMIYMAMVLYNTSKGYFSHISGYEDAYGYIGIVLKRKRTKKQQFEFSKCRDLLSKIPFQTPSLSQPWHLSHLTLYTDRSADQPLLRFILVS